MFTQIFNKPFNQKMPTPPSTPPPRGIPRYSPALRGLGPSFIPECLNHFIYVWTIYGNSFWMYPVDLIDNLLFGYAWDGSDWKYIRIPVNLIDSFY